MSLLSRLVLILVTAAVATQPASNKAPAPRISMDKIPFPDVDNADWKTFDQLPLVGKMMGQVPEKAMDGRWVFLSGETERASRLRSKLGDLKIGSVGTQFAASGGPANATDTLIGLTNGRITRVVLVFSSHLSWDDAERKLKDFSVQSVSAENGVNMYKYWGEIDRANMKYYGRVIGYWSQTIPATVKQTINGNGTVTKTAVPEQHMDGPTGIVVDIDAVSWAVANFVRPEHVADVQKHHLAEGMTEPEVRVAMFGKESRLVEQNGQTKIEFYQPPKRVRGQGQPTAVVAAGQPAPAPGGPVPMHQRRARAGGGGGGGGAINPGGGGQNLFAGNNAHNQNPNAQNGNAQASGAPDDYDGNVTIPGKGFAQEVDFNEDSGNIDPKSTLVASAVFKDGKLTQSTGS